MRPSPRELFFSRACLHWLFVGDVGYGPGVAGVVQGDPNFVLLGDWFLGLFLGRARILDRHGLPSGVAEEGDAGGVNLGEGLGALGVDYGSIAGRLDFFGSDFHLFFGNAGVAQMVLDLAVLFLVFLEVGPDGY